MLVKIELEIAREDDHNLTTEQQESIREQIQSELENLSLDEIVKYEGTAREESVTLTIEVREVK